MSKDASPRVWNATAVSSGSSSTPSARRSAAAAGPWSSLPGRPANSEPAWGSSSAGGASRTTSCSHAAARQRRRSRSSSFSATAQPSISSATRAIWARRASPTRAQSGNRPSAACSSNVSLLSDPVVAIDEHEPWLEVGELGFVVIRVAEDDDRVAGLDEARGRTVDDHVTRVAATLYGVCDEALAVVDIHDVHLLVHLDIRGVEEDGIDLDRALIVEVGVGHRCPVNLRFTHGASHGRPCRLFDHPARPVKRRPAQSRIRLSINRVPPTNAATAITL